MLAGDLLYYLHYVLICLSFQSKYYIKIVCTFHDVASKGFYLWCRRKISRWLGWKNRVTDWFNCRDIARVIRPLNHQFEIIKATTTHRHKICIYTCQLLCTIQSNCTKILTTLWLCTVTVYENFQWMSEWPVVQIYHNVLQDILLSQWIKNVD